jgi:hypothetical protein
VIAKVKRDKVALAHDVLCKVVTQHPDAPGDELLMDAATKLAEWLKATR